LITAGSIGGPSAPARAGEDVVAKSASFRDRVEEYSGVVTERLSLTAVYEPVEDGWVQATIEELPGVVTAAPSLDEAREMLVDALREYLLALGQERRSVGAREGTRREPLVISLSA
jgi:predicted RNase H-like HicB family nuclease